MYNIVVKITLVNVRRVISVEILLSDYLTRQTAQNIIGRQETVRKRRRTERQGFDIYCRNICGIIFVFVRSICGLLFIRRCFGHGSSGIAADNSRNAEHKDIYRAYK